MGKEIRGKVVLDVGASLSQIEKDVKTMQSIFDGLDATKSMEKDFGQLFTEITSKIKSIRGLTPNGMIDVVDSKQAKKDITELGTLYKRLLSELEYSGIDTRKLKTDVAAIDALTKAQNEYNNAIKATTTEQKRLQNQLDKAKNAKQVGGPESRKKVVSSERYKTYRKQVSDNEKTYREALAAKERADAAVQQRIASSEGKYTSTESKGFKQTKEFQAQKLAIQELETAYKKLNDSQSQLDGTTTIEKVNKETEKLDINFQKAKLAYDNFIQSNNSLKTEKIKALREELSKIDNIDWSSFGIDISSIRSIEDVDNILTNLSSQSSQRAIEAMNEIKKAFIQMEPAVEQTGAALQEAGKGIDSLTSRDREIENLKHRMLDFFGIENAVQLFKRAIRSAYQSVTELDEAMTGTAVVTDMSVGDLWNQLPQYTAMANKLGTTTLGAYQTATLFYQQGLKTNEVMEVSTETMKMARIAGMDYTQATNMMTAALRGFNMEINETSALRVNDVYSELAKITASDTQEISTAMTKTASLAHNAGMEFETTAAFLSQIIETTRESAETAGTALKTVIARFQELKKDPAEIGEVDGEIVDANKIETALKTINVALRDSEGQFRDLDGVFLDIAKKWDGLDTNTQRYIATMAAGSRQQSRFIAMMSNYDRTMELVSAANNSAGSSQEQFEKTTESLESKVNKLKNAWQEFTMNLANNQVIKGVVDFLTLLLQSINKITTGLGSLNGSAASFILTLTLLIKTFRGLGKLSDKYSDKLFGGIIKILNPKKIGESVKSGTNSGVKTGLDSIAYYIKQIFSSNVAAGTKEGIQKGKGREKDFPKTNKQSNIVTDEEGNLYYTTRKGDVYKKTSTQGWTKQGSENKVELNLEKEKKTNSWGYKDPNNSLVRGISDFSQGVKNLFKGDKQLKKEAFKGLFSSFKESFAASIGPLEMLTVAIIGTKVSLETIKKVYDKQTYTAEEKLSNTTEALNSLKTQISETEEAFSNITQQKDLFNEYASQLRVMTEGTREYNNIQREQNNLIQSIVSKNSELTNYTSYKNGKYNVSDSFWEKYEKIQIDKQDSLYAQQAILLSKEAQLKIEASRNETGIKTTDVTQTEQDRNLKIITGIGTGVAIIAGIASAIATGGISIPVVATTIIAGSAGGMTSAFASNSLSKIGMSESEFAVKVGALGKEYGQITAEQAEKWAKGGSGAFDERDKKFAASVFGSTESMQEFFEALNGNVEALNKNINATNQYTSTLSAERDSLLKDGQYSTDYTNAELIADQKKAEKVFGKDFYKNWWDSKAEFNQPLEGVEKNRQDYINQVLSARGYKTNAKDQYVDENGKVIKVEKNTELAEAIVAAYTADYVKKRVEEETNKTEEESQHEKKRLEERQRYYEEGEYKKSRESDKNTKIEDTVVKGLESAFEKTTNQGITYSRIGKDEENKIAEFLQREAARTGTTTQEVYDTYTKTIDFEEVQSAEDFINQILEQIATSGITYLSSIQQEVLGKTGIAKTDYSTQAGLNLDKLITKMGVDAASLGKIWSSLKESGVDVNAVFEKIDFSSEQGINAFLRELESLGINIEETFGGSISDITKKFAQLEGSLTTTSEKIKSAADAQILANDIVSENLTSLSEEQYETIKSMSGELANGFQNIGDKFYYVEGSAIELANALRAVANIVINDYQDKLKGTGQYTQSEYELLTPEQQKNLRSNPQTGLYEFKIGIDPDVVKNINKTLGYTEQGLIDTAIQYGDIKAIEESTLATEEKRKAYNALAQEYGIAASALKDLNEQETKEIALYARQKQVLDKAKESLSDYVSQLDETVDEKEKEQIRYNIADQLNAIGGDYAVDAAFVEKHEEDIRAMEQGDKEAAERIKKYWINSWIAVKTDTSSLLGQLVKEGKLTQTQLLEFSNTLYDFKLTGTADFSNIYKALYSIYGDANKALVALNKIAGTDISFNVEYEYTQVDNNGDGHASTAQKKALESAGWEQYRFGTWRRVKRIYTTDNSTGGNGISFPTWTPPENTEETKEEKVKEEKEEEKWKNPIEKFYNLNQKINAIIRKRNALEKEYNRLLNQRSTTASDLINKSHQELATLEKQRQQQQSLLYQLAARMKIYSQNKDFQKYASYNFETDTISVNWALLNSVTDPEKGEAIENYISELESIQQQIRDTSDNLLDINDSVDEIKKRGKDEYGEFTQKIYDAFVNVDQEKIDELSEYNSVMADQENAIIKALQDSIDRQRQQRSNERTQQNLSEQERRLAAMRRDTGVSAADILKAEEQLKESREDYTDTLIDQKISALQKQNEEAQELRERQVEISQKQLDALIESGRIWKIVQVFMDSSINKDTGKIIENSLLDRLLKKDSEWTSLSAQQQQDLIEENNNLAMLATSYARENNISSVTPSSTRPSVSTPSVPTSPTPSTPPSSTPSPASTPATTPKKPTLKVGSSVTVKSTATNFSSRSKNAKMAPYVPGSTYTVYKISGDQILIGRNGTYTGWVRKTDLKGFKTGGLVDFTGPAWLDGTKSKPEIVLNQTDSQNFIQLKNILSEVLSSSKKTSQTNGDNYFNIDIKVESIKNDYDVDKLASRIKQEIVKDAQYRNVNSINLMR